MFVWSEWTYLCLSFINQPHRHEYGRQQRHQHQQRYTDAFLQRLPTVLRNISVGVSVWIAHSTCRIQGDVCVWIIYYQNVDMIFVNAGTATALAASIQAAYSARAPAPLRPQSQRCLTPDRLNHTHHSLRYPYHCNAPPRKVNRIQSGWIGMYFGYDFAPPLPNWETIIP